MEQVLALLLGLAASLLQGKRGQTLGKKLRFFLSLGSCALAGFVATGLTLFPDGQFSLAAFNIDSLLENLGASFMASQVFYNTYFKKDAPK